MNIWGYEDRGSCSDKFFPEPVPAQEISAHSRRENAAQLDSRAPGIFATRSHISNRLHLGCRKEFISALGYNKSVDSAQSRNSSIENPISTFAICSIVLGGVSIIVVPATIAIFYWTAYWTADRGPGSFNFDIGPAFIALICVAIFATTAIISGIIAYQQIRRKNLRGNATAVIGIFLGLLGFGELICIFLFWFWLSALNL